MKFGKKFIHYQIPEWAEYYLDYFSLKTLLKFIDNRKIKRNGVKKLKKLKHNLSEGEIKKKRIRKISTETSNSVQPLKVNDKLQRSFPNLRCLAFDKTGVGNVLAENINHDSFYDVIDVIFSQPSKVGMVEGLVSSMESQFVTFAPDKLLQKEMSQYSRETTENDRVIYEKGESDDCLDSAMLCNVAISSYLENGPKRTKPLRFISVGDKKLKKKNNTNKDSRGRFTKQRRR